MKKLLLMLGVINSVTAGSLNTVTLTVTNNTNHEIKITQDELIHLECSYNCGSFKLNSGASNHIDLYNRGDVQAESLKTPTLSINISDLNNSDVKFANARIWLYDNFYANAGNRQMLTYASITKNITGIGTSGQLDLSRGFYWNLGADSYNITTAFKCNDDNYCWGDININSLDHDKINLPATQNYVSNQNGSDIYGSSNDLFTHNQNVLKTVNANGKASELFFAADGSLNLAECDDSSCQTTGIQVWQALDNAHNLATGVRFQSDGNLIVHDASNKALWTSQKNGGKLDPNNQAKLVLQQDGNLVIYAGDGSVLWASNTVYINGNNSSNNTLKASNQKPAQISKKPTQTSSLQQINGAMVGILPW